MSRRTALPLAGAILTIVLAACSSAAGAATVPTTAPTTATGAAAATPATDGTSTAAKVSANTASETEIAAALQSAGVANAARWTREVLEYRPYPTDDPTLQRLQDNLAKYQPDAATLAAILSALEP
jgi:hypothetical protein